MKDTSPTHLVTEEQLALLLRTVDQAARAVEEAVGYILRAQQLTKEAQPRGHQD